MQVERTQVVIKENTQEEVLKPFIRWAGGKQFLVQELLKNIPNQFQAYHEPFVGAGSLFFAKNSSPSFLSDINGPLINSYTFVRDSPEDLYEALTKLVNKTSRDYYFKIRALLNKHRNQYSLVQAARFIYLIHSSFNGIYRVNKKGEYNVPFGKPKPAIPSLDHIKKLSNKLRNTNLSVGFYDDNESLIGSGDFVYLDPPYPPISSTAYFRHYSIDRFSEEDQSNVRDFANRISEKGGNVMISNADTEYIRKLYKGWKFQELNSTRFVSCKAKRIKVKELIIKNY